METKEILDKTNQKMEKAIENLEHGLAAIRTGRANPAILDHIKVDYYGSPTPINQMAGVSVVEGRQLVIKPYDKGIIKQMSTALNTSDLGYPIQNDGDVLRINIPPLTEDTRKTLCKDAHKIGEEAKIAIRNVRRDANELAKKDKELTEDSKRDCETQVQKLTDKFSKNIEEIVKNKTNEIMSI